MSLKTLTMSAITRLPELAALKSEPYESRGILHSEIAAILALAKELRIELCIESGRARGQSTRILAKYLAADVAIHSIERSRDADAIFAESALVAQPNLTLHYGDSRALMPWLIKKNLGKRIALLIDGPKDAKAVDLFSDCLLVSDGVQVGFIHDLARLENGTASEGRARADQIFSEPFYTDDEEYVRKFRYLDRPILSYESRGRHAWTPYRQANITVASYGPTLGIIVPSKTDRERAAQRGYSGDLIRRGWWALQSAFR